MEPPTILEKPFGRRSLITSGAAAASLGLPGVANAARSQTAPRAMAGPRFSREKVMAAVRNRNDETFDLTLLAAHRGLWQHYPENSYYALFEAGKQYEIVEADIKPCADALMVFHDLVLDRCSTGHGKLIDHKWLELILLKLRDRFGRPTDHIMLRYDELIRDYALKTLLGEIDFVLAFDIKAPQPERVWGDFKAMVAYIQTKQYRTAVKNSLLFKIEARSLPDVSLMDEFVNGLPEREVVNLIVVLNPEDDKIGIRVAQYKDRPYVAAFEVGYKYCGQKDTEKFLRGLPGALGFFSTYYDLPQGVGTSQANISRLRTTTGPQATSTIDYRGRWDFWLTYPTVDERDFRLLTIDRPDIADAYLRQIGLRNTRPIERN